MDQPQNQQRPERDGSGSDRLETAQNVMEMLEKDEPVRCTCHAEEKKSQKLSLVAAICSFGALAISIASLALPFLRNADEVTFNAEAWADFLSTMEEQMNEPESEPTTYVAPTKPKPVVVTPTAPAVTTPTQTSPAETTPTETTPVETATDDGTSAEKPVEDVAAADTGTPPEQPIAADGTKTQ